MKNSIGILLISTWKYNKFIDPIITDIRKYFFPSSNVKIFLHTDSKEKHYTDVIIPITHQPWPLITLNRFELFFNNQNIYNVDYLFYLDVDCRVIDFVNEDILSEFTVVEHHWFMGTRGTPETNPNSLACIHPNENLTYVGGGFFGGTKLKFIEVAKQLSANIKKDMDNNIIALWHDESHLNRYVVDNYHNIKIISPQYLYSPENKKKYLPNPKIIPYLNSEKGFDKFENMVHK